MFDRNLSLSIIIVVVLGNNKNQVHRGKAYMNAKRLLLLLPGLFLSTSLYADWTDYFQITALTQQPASGTSAPADMFITSNYTATTSCAIKTGFHLNTNDTKRGDRMVSMLLTASIAGKRIKVYMTGSCHPWGQVDISGVRIEP